MSGMKFAGGCGRIARMPGKCETNAVYICLY
jgi:hypothetical protein